MSFVHPSRLWLLALVVGLGIANVLVQRHRQRAIARYTSSHLHHAIAPDRFGWRRHVPPALALLGLAILILGIAQPARAERIPLNEGVVVLAVDVSSSMTATDIAPSRIEAAISGATNFVNGLPVGIHVGLVAFDGNARLMVSPTADHHAVVSAVKTLTPGPRTAAGEGIYTSIDAIKASLTSDVLAAAKQSGKLPASIVLLSDGATTVGRSAEGAALAAGDAGIPVTTIAYGTPTGTVTVQGETVPVPADTATMARVAQVSGGKYFEAASAGQLKAVYTDIQTRVGYTTEPREITRGVLGVAMVMLAAATTLAFAWAARAL
jgi:Ca-activated chloride channel family protein